MSYNCLLYTSFLRIYEQVKVVQANGIWHKAPRYVHKYGIHLPYSRLVDAHNSCEISDVIFQIGSSFTIQTYPSKLQNKINIINQSSNFVQECDLKHKLYWRRIRCTPCSGRSAGPVFS